MRTIRHTAVMTAGLLLAACQSTTVPTESRVTLPAAFSQAQAAGETQNLARWWQNWRDPVLSALIEQGLANGYDIQIAQSRLAEARAQANLARADLGPTVGVSGKAAAAWTIRCPNAPVPLCPVCPAAAGWAKSI